MSIMPQQNINKLKQQSNKFKQEMFKSHKKLFKLSPITTNKQNKQQPNKKHKISINDNNLLTPQIINQFTSSKNNLQSINQLLSGSIKSKFSNLEDDLGYYKDDQQKRSKVQNGRQQKKDQNNDQIKNYSKAYLKPNQQSNQFPLSSNSFNSSHFNSNNRLVIQKLQQESANPRQPKNSQLNKQNQISTLKKQQQKLSCSESCNNVKKKIQNILESIPFQIFITFLTICSLFMEDIRTIFIQNQNDYIVDYINIFLLSSFFIEIMMSLTIQSYAFSFFFFLDIISTLSISMDITIFTDIIYNNGGNSQQISILVAQSKASRAAARAVRIMKIFRLARVVKLYKSAAKTKQLNEKLKKQKQQREKQEKLYRLRQKNISGSLNQGFQGETSQYKLSFSNSISMKDKQFGLSEKSDNGKSKTSSNRFGKQKIVAKKQAQNMDYIPQKPFDQQGSEQRNSKSNVRNSQDHQNQKQTQLIESQSFNLAQISKKQSKISKILSDSTIKKIIIVILIIMFSMTALDINNYYPQNTSWDFLVKYVAKLLKQPDVPIEHINSIIKKHVDYFQTLGLNSQIVAFQTPFQDVYKLKTMEYSQLRITQIGLSQADIDVLQILKIRPNLTLDQQFIISQNTTSLFDTVTVVISYKNFNQIDSWFSIGKIVFICLTIIYLLQSFNTNITQLIVSPIQKMMQIIINPSMTANCKKSQDEDQQQKDFKEARYQTLVVQKAIVKIRGLMSTIFGQIGMDLLYKELFKAQNISPSNFLSVKKKSFCIYGICKIQNFVQISQTLQGDTFTFINQIAHIVHSAVYKWGGFGVKNLPDGFLVVFKLPEGKQKEILEQANKNKYSKIKKNNILNILCDYSIFSLVKMIVRLHKQPKLLGYKKDQRILQKFGNNFQIQLNLAIGIGQSNEGIIGSQFKVDPTYLGGKLDDVWKISQIAQKYPNLIILEKQVYDNLTMDMKNHCRIMDYVKLNTYDEGSTEIYAVDLDLQYISPCKSQAQKSSLSKMKKTIHEKKQYNLKPFNQPALYSAQSIINDKKQLKQVLKKRISQDMKKKYLMAFQMYISGDWKDSKQYFEEILRILKDDLLSKRIYNFMAERGFKYNENIKAYKSLKDL